MQTKKSKEKFEKGKAKLYDDLSNRRDIALELYPSVQVHIL